MSEPRKSATADATRRTLVERARARTPEERVLLALQLGARDRLLHGARRDP